MPHSVTRRGLLGFSAFTASYLVFGDRVSLSPAEAVELNFTPETLTRDQLHSIERVAEQLVPGSVDAGIAAYLDAQLRAGEDSLLIGKYLGVDIPAQMDFYKSLATNLQKALQTDSPTPAVVSALWNDTQPEWEGPPASYMLFVLRADALDVTYGTSEGFEVLEIPYMAHIMPENPW